MKKEKTKLGKVMGIPGQQVTWARQYFETSRRRGGTDEINVLAGSSMGVLFQVTKNKVVGIAL